MENEHTPSQSNNSGVPSMNGEVDPKPPDIIRKIKWILLNGRRHWALVLTAFFIIFGGWMATMTSGLSFLKNTSDLLVNRKIRRTVNDLRHEFPRAVNELSQSGTNNFSAAERDLSDILKLDPANGHGLYYSGEVQRITSPESPFTPKSCPIAAKLAKNHGTLDIYQNAFLRYLDIEKTIQGKELKEDFAAEACYMQASGYCAQRTAWINHLLANDMYEEAILSNEPATKKDMLQRARKYADTANKYRDEKGNFGFFQCTSTTVLIGKIKDALANLDAISHN